MEDSRPVYETIVCGQVKYEFEIDAETGKVLSGKRRKITPKGEEGESVAELGLIGLGHVAILSDKGARGRFTRGVGF
ncbi:MAG: PepSY domain-containing protein [Christensenellales bacterium]